MTRILVLHSQYSSGSVSGENRVVEDEVALLRLYGHEVTVWCPESPRGARSQVKMGFRAIHSTRAAERVRQIIGKTKPQVVHVHNLFPNLSPSIIGAARGHAPVIISLHNYRLLCLPATFVRGGEVCESCLGRTPWRGVVHRCYRGSLPGSASLGIAVTLSRARRSFTGVTFLAVSEFVRAKHVAGGFNSASIRVKHNFAWPQQNRSSVGDYFLFAGRFSEEKGVLPLVRGWSAEAPMLLVVGDGPEAEHVRKRASANIEIRPPVAPSAMPNLIRGARAVIVPSRCYEGAPRSIVEAYAAGVPVIAASRGAIPEFVRDGVNGVLVESGDPSAYVQAARSVTAEVSERLGAEARLSWKRHFSPDVAISALEEIYEDMLAVGHAAP